MDIGADFGYSAAFNSAVNRDYRSNPSSEASVPLATASF
jgi:hypothetical protein